MFTITSFLWILGWFGVQRVTINAKNVFTFHYNSYFGICLWIFIENNRIAMDLIYCWCTSTMGRMHVCKMHKTNPIRLTIASYGAVEAHMHPDVLCVLRAIFIFMWHKLVMIYLGTILFLFGLKFWNIHGANLSIHVVYVCIGCVWVCARFYCRGILTWQRE